MQAHSRRLHPQGQVTHVVHIDAFGVGPRVLERFLQSAGEGLGDVVKVDEVLHALHLFVIFVRPLVHAQHDGRYVAKNGGAE